MDPERRRVTVKIGQAAGDYPDAPRTRAWVLRLHPAPELGPVQEVRLDGRRITGWRLIAKGLAPTPFQLRGAALDGDVVEVELPTMPVGRDRVVELRYR